MTRDSLLSKIRTGAPMSTGEQLRLMAVLSWPAILSQLSMIVMEYIDAAMVGSMGTYASASIGLMATSTWLFWGMLTSAAQGFSVQVAHRIGANDRKGAQSVLRQSLVVTVLFSLCLMAFGLCICHRLPVWLGGQDEIVGAATTYFTIFVCTLPILQISFLAGSMLRCSGNTLISGVLNVCMCLLDVVFNFFFIFPTREMQIAGISFTMPGAGMGVAGAALGTGAAELLTGSIQLWYLWKKNRELNLRDGGGTYRPQRQVLKRAFKIGAPIGVEHMLLSGAQVVSTIIVAPLGAVAIAANAFAVTAESLCYMPGYGISEAATTLVGQSVGAMRKKLARRFAYMTVGAGMAVMSVMGVVMYIAAPLMMGIITPVEEICALGVEVLRIEAWAEPGFAAAIVAYGVFVGAGDTLIPCAMNLGSMWGVRIVLAAILAPTLGLRGVWIAMAVELAFRGLIFLWRLKSKAWLKDKIT